MSDDEIEYYGDEGIASGDARVPLWLKVTYVILPLWGVLWLILYWNGMSGWLDRGHWFELEQAAKTTVGQW